MPHGDSTTLSDPLLSQWIPSETNYTDVGPWTDAVFQVVQILPVIGNPHQYYVFTLAGIEASTKELFYTVVDMTLHNGLGDVIQGQEGVYLDGNLADKITAVAGDNCDLWLLVHDGIGLPLIKSYHITSSGIDPTPVESIVGNLAPPPYGVGGTSYFEGMMKVSPNRKKLAVCSYAPASQVFWPGTPSNTNGIEVYDFDPATGIASNTTSLSVGEAVFSACFSPDNTKLYGWDGNHEVLNQYDLTAPPYNPVAIAYDTGAAYYPQISTDLQLAPDGKIYLPDPAWNFIQSQQIICTNCFMDCISSPNEKGTACNYTPNAIRLHNENWLATNFDLPSLFVKPIHNTTYVGHPDTVLCTPPGILTLTAPPGYPDYLWNNGQTNQIRTIDRGGTYVVMSGDSSYCNVRYDTFPVKGVNMVFSLGPPDTTICLGQPSLLLHIPIQAESYLWQDGSTNSSYTVTHPGTYYATVRDEGCSYSDTINVNTPDVKQSLGADTLFCTREPIEKLLQAQVPPGANVMWSTGSTAAQIDIADTGTYWVTVTDNTCVGSDTIVIGTQICDCLYGIPNAFTPNGDGKNDVFHPIFEPGCPVSSYSLMIYNRWGQLVFSSASVEKGWDGMQNGIPAELGTYMYQVEFVAGTEAKLQYKKGDITLVR